jgi:hypothetical protein
MQVGTSQLKATRNIQHVPSRVILLTLRYLAMYPCTVRAAQYRSLTQRSNTETRDSSETKLRVRGTLIYLLVQSMLTANGGRIVAILDGTAGFPPVGSADREHPAILTFALNTPAAVRSDLTHTAYASINHWTHRMACEINHISRAKGKRKCIVKYSSTLSLTSALYGGGWSKPRIGHFTPWNRPVPIVREAGWAPMPVWTSEENLVPTWIRSPDRLASCYTDCSITDRISTGTIHMCTHITSKNLFIF